MKWMAWLGAAALALPVCAVEHRDTYQRSFPLTAGERKLVVENINGSIRVTADSGNDIRVTVREEFRPMVEAHARYLAGNRVARVTLQGNGDERGSREYNIALGQKRADAVTA